MLQSKDEPSGFIAAGSGSGRRPRLQQPRSSTHRNAPPADGDFYARADIDGNRRSTHTNHASNRDTEPRFQWRFIYRRRRRDHSS